MKNNLKRKKILSLCILIFSILLCVTSFAHPGSLDDNGGHNDYKNSSGLGSYHYHHGYPAHLHENGECPYGFEDATSSDTSAHNAKSSFFVMGNIGTWRLISFAFIILAIILNMLMILLIKDILKHIPQLEPPH